MKRTSRSLILATFCLVAGATRAQGQATPPAAPSLGDPVARSLFEPELIMKHRRAIELTDQQRDAISKLIRELQGRVVSMQWDLQDQVEALGAELNRPRVDLDRAQDRMSRVLQTEREIKAAHLTLLIRIKNQLTPAQQESLRKLRNEPGAGSDADATVGDRPALL
jgi:Spy/CpxP family protein refolding chaperone